MSTDASTVGIFLSACQYSGDSEWRQAMERDVEDGRLGDVTQTPISEIFVSLKL